MPKTLAESLDTALSLIDGSCLSAEECNDYNQSYKLVRALKKRNITSVDVLVEICDRQQPRTMG